MIFLARPCATIFPLTLALEASSPKRTFFSPGVDGENLAESHLFTDFARDPLDANGVARCDTILLSPGLNNGVHLPSKL